MKDAKNSLTNFVSVNFVTCTKLARFDYVGAKFN